MSASTRSSQRERPRTRDKHKSTDSTTTIPQRTTPAATARSSTTSATPALTPSSTSSSSPSSPSTPSAAAVEEVRLALAAIPGQLGFLITDHHGSTLTVSTAPHPTLA